MKAGISACSKRRRRKNDIPYLPHEIILNVLIWLPADFLHNIGKYVCKIWASIIRDPLFIKTHLLHSNAGLFIQNQQEPFDARYFEVREGELKMTHIKRHFEGVVLFSCEGISLFTLGVHHPMLYVANFVTIQVLKLPSLPAPAVSSPWLFLCYIARIPQTGKFKVISPWKDLDGLYYWLVVTIGTDMSWRKIECGFTENKLRSFGGIHISICGVIYLARITWMNKKSGVYSMEENSSRILAVDLHNESIHFIQFPEEFFGNAFGLLEMGNYLSCIVLGTNGTDVNLWILKDLYRSEWAKVRKIEAVVERSKIWDHHHIPMASLDSGRILIFYHPDKNFPRSFVNLVAYDLKTKVRRTIRNVNHYVVHSVIWHTNSLVSW